MSGNKIRTDQLSEVGLRGYISGFILSNDPGDTAHDIAITAGVCRDSQNTVMMAGSAMVKRIDATWVAGTGNGGRFDGSFSDGWYHVFAIRKDSDGTIDFGFNTSLTAANIPSGYTAYRRLGSVLVSSSSIKQFAQFGDEFLWYAAVHDVDLTGASGDTTRKLATLSVPPGVNVSAYIRSWVYKWLSLLYVIIQSPDVSDFVPSAANGYTLLGLYEAGDSFTAPDQTTVNVRTNTSRQIAYRSDNVNNDFHIWTYGWLDPRGKDA